jgi:DNA-binding SARP family transcriptional activator
VPFHADGPAAGSVELVTLGRACCWSTALDGSTRTLLHGGKSLALLIYTALSPNRSVTRQHLIDLLWSNSEPDVARADLRQALWYLRHVTGGHVITGADEVLSVDRRVGSDHQLFIQAARTHDHAAALSAYAGDFLPMFASQGGARFEQWADLERQRLQTLYSAEAEAAVSEALGRNEPGEAIHIARLAASIARTERIHRLLITALLAGGADDEASVHAHYADREFGGGGGEDAPLTRRQPVSDHRALSPPPPGANASSKAAVTTRTAEFANLREAWSEAGRLRYVYRHVSGAPGTGKSRLLADLVTHVRAATGCVVAVAARSVERAIPFSLLSKLAAALGQLRGARGISPTAARTLVGLNPTLSSVFYAEPIVDRPHDALRNRSTAMQELIAVVADEAPLCIVIDDVHHTDDASRRSLEAIAANLAREPVLLLTASCAHEECLR